MHRPTLKVLSDADHSGVTNESEHLGLFGPSGLPQIKIGEAISP
jgi:hypothetical protein